MVTLGPLTAPESPGVLPALRAMCPAKQVKADLSRFYFSICSSKIKFTPFHTWGTILFLICPWTCLPRILLPEKTRQTSPCFKPCYRLVFFTTILNQSCLPGESPSHCSPPYTTLTKHFQTGSSLICSLLHCSLLPVLSCTAAWNQAWTEKGRWAQSKPSFEHLTTNSHLMGGSPALILRQVASLVDF